MNLKKIIFKRVSATKPILKNSNVHIFQKKKRTIELNLKWKNEIKPKKRTVHPLIKQYILNMYIV